MNAGEMPGGPAPALAEALATAIADYRAANPVSAAIAAAAAGAMPGGNTRTSLWYDPFPLCMVQGAGAQLTDADGHHYLDLLGEFTSGIYGHTPAIVRDAIDGAMARGINLSGHNRIESEFAHEIRNRIPSMELLRFTNSGTEANLMALCAARLFTGRDTILAFRGGYHGGGLTFTGPSRANLPFDFLFAGYNDIEETTMVARAHGDGIAAILVEPMQGAGGCIPGEAEFLRLLRRLADETGALLIFDEIQTSRLAPGGRQSLLAIRPDLTTIGKFYGGGLAFGCFGGRADVMAMFDPRRADGVPHSGTFNNNTLTLSAGLAAVRHLLTPEALDTLNARGDRLREALEDLFARTAAPLGVTGLGSLMNIHPYGRPANVAALRQLLFFDAVAEGFYFASRGLIALSLPLGDEGVDRFVDALHRIISRRQPLFATIAAR